MEGVAGLAEWLGTLDAAQLTAVIEKRPDVRRGAVPRNLTELAQRLEHPESLASVLHTVALPLLEAAEALQALGDQAANSTLGRLLAGAGERHDADVASVLAGLRDAAIAWPGPHGRIRVAAGLAQVFPRPLGLSAPLRVLLPTLTVDDMRRIVLTLGVRRPPTRRAELEAELVRWLIDPVRVRSSLATAPEDVAEQVLAVAGATDPVEELTYDYERYQRRQAASQWAADRGLLIGPRYGYDATMPAEVGLALRGPDYRAPFTPRRPEPSTHATDHASVASAAAAAATDFANQASAVLDALSRTPVPLAKSGGIAARELARLAKAAGTDELSTRLTLELAAASGLLASNNQSVYRSEHLGWWRAADPGPRYAALVSAWWQSPLTPTEAIDIDGKTTRALSRRARHAGGRTARAALIAAMASIPAGLATDRGSIADAALWDRPLAPLLAQDGRDRFATVWREAELLGVIAAGACGELGRTLPGSDEPALASLATVMLPASSERAVFGSDLTVLVAGSPSARVSTLLDSAADRESRGAAITWRFSESSVRRALDEGVDAGTLASELAAVASRELPQPLRYLLGDVARRHGALRLSAAETLVRGDDSALLAEVAADRRLLELGLRLLAPTVLSSQAPLHETMLALRKAGYFPMPEDDSPDGVRSQDSASASGALDEDPGAVARTRLEELPRPVAAARDTPQPVPAGTLAAALLTTAQRTELRLSGTEATLLAQNRRLSAEEIRQLAYAVDTQASVVIGYESSSGARTRRTISDASVSGGSLFAWCYLRNDTRVFTVARVLSVAPAS